jgi:hypothetical protein
MALPEHFEESTEYLCYKPVGQVTFAQVIASCSGAVIFARTHDYKRLLVDTTGLTGFASPSTFDRFEFAQQCAYAAHGAVKVAFLAKPEMIDPDQFGLDVARNRGFWTAIFASEAQALQWLLDPNSP